MYTLEKYRNELVEDVLREVSFLSPYIVNESEILDLQQTVKQILDIDARIEEHCKDNTPTVNFRPAPKDQVLPVDTMRTFSNPTIQ